MSTADVRASLRAVLSSERACCARLLSILEAERSAAAAYDQAGLLACLKERETIQADWQRSADARRRALRAGGAAVTELVKGDMELAALVASARADAMAVRREQRVNEAVVRRLLVHVNDLLTVIRRELPGSRYDGRAALTTSLPTSGGSWSA
jgi:hypothetical protein